MPVLLQGLHLQPYPGFTSWEGVQQVEISMCALERSGVKPFQIDRSTAEKMVAAQKPYPPYLENMKKRFAMDQKLILTPLVQAWSMNSDRQLPNLHVGRDVQISCNRYSSVLGQEKVHVVRQLTGRSAISKLQALFSTTVCDD